MASLEEQLRSFLVDEAFVAKVETTSKRKKCLVLSEERQPDSALTVIDIPDNLVVIKGDSFLPLLLKKTERNGRQYHGSAFFKLGG